MKLSTWIGLLFCNIAWSLNPTVAKIMIESIGPKHTAWFKYTVALIAYLIFKLTVPNSINTSNETKNFTKTFAKNAFMPLKMNRDLLKVCIIGFATCFVAPMTQMSGLVASTATNNAILVTFEPVFTVFFGWLIFKEKLLTSHYWSFFLAILGFLILSHFFNFKDHTLQNSVGVGDLILLVTIAGESIYSVFGRGLSQKYEGTKIFGTAMAVGVFLLSVIILPWKGLPHFSQLSYKIWAAIFWMGIIGTTLPYLYWLHALNQSLTLGSVVLSLFLQPLIGTISAVLFLGEPLGIHQLLGGLVLLMGVGYQVYVENKK